MKSNRCFVCSFSPNRASNARMNGNFVERIGLTLLDFCIAFILLCLWVFGVIFHRTMHKASNRCYYPVSVAEIWLQTFRRIHFCAQWKRIELPPGWLPQTSVQLKCLRASVATDKSRSDVFFSRFFTQKRLRQLWIEFACEIQSKISSVLFRFPDAINASKLFYLAMTMVNRTRQHSAQVRKAKHSFAWVWFLWFVFWNLSILCQLV